MTYDIRKEKIAWLTYLIYIILTALSLSSVFMSTKIEKISDKLSDIPKEYVSLERYNCDVNRIYDLLKNMDIKLERIAHNGGLERNR